MEMKFRSRIVFWFAAALAGLAFLFVPCRCFSQNAAKDSVENFVAELNRAFSYIYSCGEEERWHASDSFVHVAQRVLQQYAGREFPFERVNNLNYFKAENGCFRMLNWGIPDAGGTVVYKALLQVRRNTKHDYVLYDLSDMSVYMPFPEEEVLTPETWWGAYYYQCIEKETPSKTYYTFLGWNSGQNLYQQSVIEVMTVKNDGTVEFGSPLFAGKSKGGGSADKRVVFRFSRKSGMILRYDYQTCKVKNSKGKWVNRKENMIIFDVLGPQQSTPADDYSYYVPLGGKYNAYVFENNKWRLKTEVEARNPDPKKHKL